MAHNVNMVKEAKELAQTGHSFLITGQCGTGKTYLLKSLVKYLSLNMKKKVAITATTGMASNQLGLEATTLHHWSGIFDGRYDKDQLAELFHNDDLFANARSRIIDADVLCIDEISMLSQRTFELVEFVCRFVRKTTKTFGGLQVIGCGDFKQLPPVPNFRMQDNGAYCLESKVFKDVFPHHINLTKVVRQDEQDLIKAVHELCDGCPSDETFELLKSLDRPLPIEAEITCLHGTNFDVNYINHEKLDEMEGQAFNFKAKDEGPAHLLRFTNAPKNLLLKEGAPVLLIRNISHGLFNGTRGKVHTLKKDCPPVIEVDGKLITLSHYKFELYDREQKKVLATRMQYPIMLSFAMTVHRAQGQTLEFVDVDCASFFAAGQLGVAIGRVKSKNGLRVRNLNRTAAVLKHAACVYEFYDKINHAEAFVDLSCCNAVTSYASDLNLSHGACNSVVAECVENNEIIDDNIEIVEVELPKLPCPWSIEEFISLNKGGSFLTSLPENFYHCERLSDHLQFLYYNVNKIVLAPFASNKSQLWNAACTSLNKFLLSDAHINACKQLFHVNIISKSHNKFSTKLVWWLLEKQVDKKASEINDSQTEKNERTDNTKTYSSAGKAKIRHVAGASVCKITQKLQASVLNNMGTTSKKGKIKQKFDYKMQTMLRNFRIKEIEAPKDDTMTEILSKQGPSRGLTIVNDEVFSFFLNLNTAVQKKTSFDYFHLYGKMAFHTCRNAIDNNDELINQWINLFGVSMMIILRMKFLLPLSWNYGKMLLNISSEQLLGMYRTLSRLVSSVKKTSFEG